MSASYIICLIIYFMTASIMVGIGISQLRAKTAVAFYSGEKPFNESELSDVSMWNKKHGAMWIIYGIVIMISYALGILIGIDSLWCILPMIGGLMIPIFIMIWYHHKLIRQYKR